MPASANPDTAKIAQRGALYFVLPCVAVMRLLPEVSPRHTQRTKTESTAIGNQVGVTTIGGPESLWDSGGYRCKSMCTGG